jgi:hypothetical protein
VIARHPQLACIVIILFILCAPSISFAANGSAEAKKIARIFEGQQRQPLILFVAKGAPNACGTGCSEWIAAEGKIDPSSSARLKEFLAALPRRDLPIFFNSDGGSAGAAAQIGETLRQYRMTVGVGRTIPEGCDNSMPIGDSCRRLMQSKPEHRARLAIAGSRCASACVFAIVGGSVRRIGREARLGIHALRGVPGSRPTIEQVYRQLKRYFLEMGVDPGIVDASAQTSADDIHFMSRAEIARFGIETTSPFETRWLASQDSSGRGWVFKAWTDSETPEGMDYRTTVVKLACDMTGNLTGIGAAFSLRRELQINARDYTTAFEVIAGAAKLRLRGVPVQIGIGSWYARTSLSLLDQAAASPQIEISEVMPAQGAGAARVIKLSTVGLSDALRVLRTHCFPSHPEQLLRTLPSTWR